MEKSQIELTNAEIIRAFEELNGVFNQQTGQKTSAGILDSKMLVLGKYWIGELNTVITEERKKIDEFKNELIKKYGTFGEDGSVSIPQVIEEDGITKVNPNLDAFINDFSEVLNCTKTIEYYPIDIKYLDFETDVDLRVFFKFVKK